MTYPAEAARFWSRSAGAAARASRCTRGVEQALPARRQRWLTLATRAGFGDALLRTRLQNGRHCRPLHRALRSLEATEVLAEHSVSGCFETRWLQKRLQNGRHCRPLHLALRGLGQGEGNGGFGGALSLRLLRDAVAGPARAARSRGAGAEERSSLSSPCLSGTDDEAKCGTRPATKVNSSGG